jgi:hypothetical protein
MSVRNRRDVPPAEPEKCGIQDVGSGTAGALE